MQKGSKHSDETKARMSEARKGKNLGNTYGAANKGRPPTAGFTGHKHSEETKAKMAETRKAQHANKRKGKEQ